MRREEPVGAELAVAARVPLRGLDPLLRRERTRPSARDPTRYEDARRVRAGGIPAMAELAADERLFVLAPSPKPGSARSACVTLALSPNSHGCAET